MIEAEWIGELNLKQLPEPSMRHTLHEEITKLSTGTTIRLLRCRSETMHKIEIGGIKVLDDTDIKVGRTKNELVASFWDDKKKKYRDFIRMTVADTLPEAMPEFLMRSRAEIERLAPRFNSNEKVARTDCQTASDYEDFAEILSRR